MYLYGQEIDERLTWPAGTAMRLARRKKLPHVLLPDGSIRFEWDAVLAMVRRVPAEQAPGFPGPAADLVPL